MRRPEPICPLPGPLTVNQLARLFAMEGRLASALLHSVAPAGWTPLGRPAWRLEDALAVLRPDLAHELAPVLRCRLARPAGTRQPA